MTINDQRFGDRGFGMTSGPADIWFCEHCRASEKIALDPKGSIDAAVRHIRIRHQEKSPHCITGTTEIRLVNKDQLFIRGLVA